MSSAITPQSKVTPRHPTVIPTDMFVMGGKVNSKPNS